jgi:MFS family permease
MTSTLRTSTRKAGRRAFASWLTANVISLAGTRLSMVALPWFVLTTTGSAAKTGLVGFAEMLPYVVAKAAGGPVIDRVGARKVSVIADIASVVAVGTVPALHHWGVLTFPILLALVAVAGLVRGPGDGAKSALVPDIADHAGLPLERITGMAGAADRLAGTIGAAVAGVIVSVLGPVSALTLDAATFGAAALLVAAGVPSWRASGMAEEPPTDQTYVRQMKEGWDFLRTDAVLVSIVFMVAATNLLDQAYATVFIPVWAHDSGRGAAAIGLVFAFFSAASVLGSLLAASFADRLPRLPTYFLAFLICGAPRFVVFAIHSPIVVIVAVTVAGGFASGFINPILGAVIYERIPRPLMGRVTSLNTSLCWATIPFGGILGGGLIAAAGLAPALLVVGGAYFAATMLPAVLPQWRQINKPAAPVGTSQSETTELEPV